MKICIFGAASAHIDKKYIDVTERLGRLAAERNHSLVFGAGAAGLMGAAARGFKKGGGFVHGVIPEFFRDENVEPIFDGCDKVTYTKTMGERKQVMEDEAEAFIIAPGGVGTFEEFFEVLTLKQLGRHNKAMAILNIDGYYDELEKFMVEATERKFITFGCGRLYMLFDDPLKTLEYIETYVPENTHWRLYKNG